MNRSFTGLTGAYTDNWTETSGTVPEKVVCAIVAPSFFSVLRTQPLLKRKKLLLHCPRTYSGHAIGVDTQASLIQTVS